jgi:hypothetical protein
MTSNNWLFLFIVGLLGLTGWMIASAPEITPEEREDMEEDWWA